MTNLVLLILITVRLLAVPQVTNPLPQCDPCPFVR
jgi:hypothetical protein